MLRNCLLCGACKPVEPGSPQYCDECESTPVCVLIDIGAPEPEDHRSEERALDNIDLLIKEVLDESYEPHRRAR